VVYLKEKKQHIDEEKRRVVGIPTLIYLIILLFCVYCLTGLTAYSYHNGS
jgi:hypothetical protein